MSECSQNLKQAGVIRESKSLRSVAAIRSHKSTVYDSIWSYLNKALRVNLMSRCQHQPPISQGGADSRNLPLSLASCGHNIHTVPADREASSPSLQSALALWSLLTYRMWHMWPCVTPRLCLNSDHFHLPQTERSTWRMRSPEDPPEESWPAVGGITNHQTHTEATLDLQLSWLSSSGVGKLWIQTGPSACFHVGPLS